MPNAFGTEVERALLALALVETCFRNTRLEDLHAGPAPPSASGDGSDVTVTGPIGSVPWSAVSRISDAEMRSLMIEAVDKVFTFLSAPEHLLTLAGARRWKRPALDQGLQRVIERRAALKAGMPESEMWERFPPIGDAAPSPASPISEEVEDLAVTLTPDDLCALAQEARLDIGWVRQARSAMMTAARDWERSQLELLDAYEVADFGR